MRGPCWSPYVTWTDDGVHWARGRTLLRAPDPKAARAVRPYAKYAPAADGSILLMLSDGHPDAWRSGLYFARFRDGRFHSAGGELLGDLAAGPPAVRELERVHAPRDGRAWPMDVAEDAGAGTPSHVYTSLDRERDDTFRYARFDAGPVGDAPDRRRRRGRLRLPQPGRDAGPRRPATRRPEPHDRRPERDRAAQHARRRPDVGGPAR